VTLSVRIRHRLGAFALDAGFDAPPGVTVLFGRSGSGKTTIVNAVAGLLRPEEGRIALDGDVLCDTARRIWRPPHRRRLGYVFQDSRLFPHLSVRQNLRYGRWFAGIRDGPEEARVLDMLAIGPLLDRRPADLSGGERSRVALGRALLSHPRLLLADEPLAALDEARKAEILPYFERLRDEARVPILYISHAAAEVARLATTIVALDGGRVTAQGPAAELLADPTVVPTGIRAAGAVLSARVVAHHADGLSELEAGGVPLFVPRVPQAVGRLLRLRVPAHEVILSRTAPEGLSALNVVPGRITAIREGEGPGVIVTLASPAGNILARVTRRSALRLDLSPGTACHAIVKSVAIAREDIGGTDSPAGSV
jgi:molybdate transport system ATP-binding protein